MWDWGGGRGLKRNQSRDDSLLHVNQCVVLQHKLPGDFGVSEDPVASVWFLLTGHASTYWLLPVGKKRCGRRVIRNLLKHTSLRNSRQQILHTTQFIIKHPECDIISNREELVESRGWRKWGPGSVSYHHFWELRSNSAFEVHCRDTAGLGLLPAFSVGKMLHAVLNAQMKVPLGTVHDFMEG